MRGSNFPKPNFNYPNPTKIRRYQPEAVCIAPTPPEHHHCTMYVHIQNEN